jgi:hypothetical protein
MQEKQKEEPSTVTIARNCMNRFVGLLKKRKPAQEWTSPYKPYHHENTNVGHNWLSTNKDIL